MLKKEVLAALVAGAKARGERVTVAGAEAVLNALNEVVAQQVAAHGQFRVLGLVTLTLKPHGPRVARNPRTREEITIPAGDLMKARPVAALVDRVHELKVDERAQQAVAT